MKILCKYAKKKNQKTKQKTKTKNQTKNQTKNKKTKKKNMEALSKYHYQKNKRNVGPKERGKKRKNKQKTDGPMHGDVLYTPSRVHNSAIWI